MGSAHDGVRRRQARARHLVAPRRRLAEARLRALEERLAHEPAAAELLAERARLVEELGSREQAIAAYADVLRVEPARYDAMLRFGALLVAAGDADAARTVFAEAIARHPGFAAPRVALAATLADGGETAAALELYRAAAAAEPGHREAARGIAIALERLGRPDEAATCWRDAFFPGGAFDAAPYRGAGAPVRALCLLSALGGNVPLQHVVDDRIFATTTLLVESAPADVALPPHDVLVNAIGDADRCARALRLAARVTARTRARIVNAPEAVAATTREQNALRFGALEGIVAAPVRRVRRGDAAAHGLGWPVLLRSPGYHTGEHFVRVDAPGDLGAALTALPGDELLAIGWLDTRGADGAYRKARLMAIGGRLYPLHLAISDDWKVHYVTAGMDEHAERRAEEAAFLADPAATLGARNVERLAAAAARLHLDYAGLDVGVLPDGRAAIFEANATMVILPPGPDPRWEYRRPAVTRALAAARALLAGADVDTGS